MNEKDIIFADERKVRYPYAEGKRHADFYNAVIEIQAIPVNGVGFYTVI